METAKVDVRKLQLLNDRINQCLDALNQVRLSTYGLSHTQANVPNVPFGAAGPMTGAFDPRFAYGMPPITPGIAPGIGGLSHSPFVAQGNAGLTPGIGGAGIPFQGVPFQSPFQQPYQSAAQFPIWNSPIGLSHTGIEAESLYNRPLWADPLLAARVAQTFPYVQYGVPPVAAIW
jgi:hypothetical protein